MIQLNQIFGVFRFASLRLFRVIVKFPERETTSPTVIDSRIKSNISNISDANFSGIGSNEILFCLLDPTELEFLTYPVYLFEGAIGCEISFICIPIVPNHCRISLLRYMLGFPIKLSILSRLSIKTSGFTSFVTFATAIARKISSDRVLGWSRIQACNRRFNSPCKNINFNKFRAVWSLTLVFITQKLSLRVISDDVERLFQRNTRFKTFLLWPNSNCSIMV